MYILYNHICIMQTAYRESCNDVGTQVPCCINRAKQDAILFIGHVVITNREFKQVFVYWVEMQEEIHLYTAAIIWSILQMFKYIKDKSLVTYVLAQYQWSLIIYKTSGGGLCGQLTEMLLTTMQEKNTDKSIQLLVFSQQKLFLCSFCNFMYYRTCKKSKGTG